MKTSQPKVDHYGDYDLRGETIGELTVIEPFSRGGTRGVVWETVCSCGAVQYRTTSVLTRARDMGKHPLCPKCLAEWRLACGYKRVDAHMERLYSAIQRINPKVLESPERTRSLLNVLLQQYGLYGHAYNDHETTALQEEFDRVLGPLSDAMDSVPEAMPPWEGLEDQGLDWSDFYPMAAPEGYALHCHDCRKNAARGWGCVHCMVFSCYRCVTGGTHTCRPATYGRVGQLDGLTLAVLGEHLGVSRERVRQYTERSLRILRQTYRDLDGAAEAKQLAARWAITSQIPDPAGEEAAWAATIARRREINRKVEEAAAARVRAALVWALRRFIALDQVKREPLLPWDLKHPPSGIAETFVFGESALQAKSLEGLVSCVTCRKILLYGSAEAQAHALWHDSLGQCWLEGKDSNAQR